MTQYIGQITVIIDAHDESIAETQPHCLCTKDSGRIGDVVFADHNGDVENYEELERECQRSARIWACYLPCVGSTEVAGVADYLCQPARRLR